MNYPEKVVNSTTDMVIYQQIAGLDACNGLDKDCDETVKSTFTSIDYISS
jgi:hypothetical protein